MSVRIFISTVSKEFIAYMATAMVAGSGAFAQTADHVEIVKKKALSANYVENSAINGCPVVEDAILGWPAGIARTCIYEQDGLKALAYVVDIKPEVLARWVETGCNKYSAHSDACFNITLACAKFNSGTIYPIAGNVVEDWRNIFFRNGMTVTSEMDGKVWSFTSTAMDLDAQDRFAMLTDAEVVKDRDHETEKSPIPSGLTRLWRTRPSQFAKTYPESGAPKDMSRAEWRQAWLDLSKKEFLAALKNSENRLLTAWLATHLDVVKTWPTDRKTVDAVLDNPNLADRYCPSN